MALESRVKNVPVSLAVVTVALMVFVVATPAVSASAAVSASSSSSSPIGTWSYGAEKTVTLGPVRASDGWVYEGSYTIGYTVTVYQNSTGNSTFEMTVYRTIGASYSLRFCSPSCVSPYDWVNLSYRAYQDTTGFSNFTTAGAVVEGARSVPAVAVANSTVFLRSNLTESVVEHLPSLGIRWLGDHDYYLAAQVNGNAAIDFTPSLGIVPLNLSSGTSWSAMSQYVLAGSGLYSYYYSAHLPLHNTTLGPVSGPIDFAGTGNVSVTGSYGDGSTVSLGGVTYPAIDLTITGPFTVLEGVVFLPNPADLFSGSNDVAVNASSTTSFAQSAVDAKFLGGTFHLGASSWRYFTDSQNPADEVGAAQPIGTPGLAAATTTANPVAASTVQGEPESPAQATSTSQCLTTGVNCPSAGSSGNPRTLVEELVVVGAVATVGVLVILAAVSRRSLPPPAYPNAVLYPPGGTTARPPAGAPGAPTPQEPPEEDPLDHLW